MCAVGTCPVICRVHLRVCVMSGYGLGKRIHFQQRKVERRNRCTVEDVEVLSKLRNTRICKCFVQKDTKGKLFMRNNLSWTIRKMLYRLNAPMTCTFLSELTFSLLNPKAAQFSCVDWFSMNRHCHYTDIICHFISSSLWVIGVPPLLT